VKKADRLSISFLAIPILVLGFAWPAAAAEAQQGTTVYTADYFANLNVLTVRDMVRRIPGSEAQLPQNPAGGPGGGGGQRRGLRDKTDRILIDGKKLTGKANETDDFLERLPASKVLRIEVVAGMVTETESDAGARTINIITTGEGGGSGTWQASLRWLDDLRTTTGGTLSYSGQIKSADYAVGITTTPNGSLTHRDDIEYVAGIPVERILETRTRTAHKTKITGSTRMPLSDTRTLQINGLYEKEPREGVNHDDIFDFLPDGSQRPIGFSDEPLRRTREIWEVGGTYERQLNDANLFQILFLRNENDNDRQSRKTTTDINGQIVEQNHEIRDEHAEETVLRGTWFAKRESGREFDLGLELAVNTLDKLVALSEGQSEPLSPVVIPNADQVIREDRAEIFANYSFSISNLRVRLGLAAEYSEFDQQGSDVSLNRTLNYVKPSIDLSYEGENDRRYFLTFKRDVSQLDFDDFVASIDPVDREIRAGNPNLLPETSWDLEVGSEHRFGEDTGLLKLRLFHRWVEDVNDLIPLDLDDSQPGNLPDGRHWGINIVFGLRFQDLGLPGAVLNGFYTWQDSEVIDPFSGETRPFLNQKQFEAGFEFRHDIERFRGAYGISWSGEGRRHRYDVDRVDINWNDDAIEMFLERRLRGSMILRLAANQIYEPKSERERFNYDFGRSTGIQTSTVSRDQVLRRFATLSLSGTF